MYIKHLQKNGLYEKNIHILKKREIEYINLNSLYKRKKFTYKLTKILGDEVKKKDFLQFFSL